MSYITKADWRIYASVNQAIHGSDNDLSPLNGGLVPVIQSFGVSFVVNQFKLLYQ